MLTESTLALCAQRCRRFLESEEGSTTADWVILTSGVIGMSLGAISFVRSGAANLGNDISGSLTRASVVSLGTIAAAPQPRYVISAGRGYVEEVEGTCTKDGCTQGYTSTNMYYQLSDDSWANMVFIEYRDGTTSTTWTDTSGRPIVAPRFQN